MKSVKKWFAMWELLEKFISSRWINYNMTSLLKCYNNPKLTSNNRLIFSFWNCFSALYLVICIDYKDTRQHYINTPWIFVSSTFRSSLELLLGELFHLKEMTYLGSVVINLFLLFHIESLWRVNISCGTTGSLIICHTLTLLVSFAIRHS